MTINEKLAVLRQRMKEIGVDAYIIPSSDPHLSEYIAEHYKFRAWISGFTGSAGTVVVTMDKSGLWTDGRYYIQAEKELDSSEIVLFKAMEPGVIGYVDWVCENLKKGQTVGFAGTLFSKSSVDDMKKKFSKKGIKINTGYDLSYDVWKDRPALPYEKVFVHDIKYSGESTQDKLARVRDELKKEKATHYVLSTLDSIMWLYNIRGRDIPNCPVAICYALVGPDFVRLYIDKRQLDESVEKFLSQSGVEIRAYDDIWQDLSALAENDVLYADFARTNYNLIETAKKCKKVNKTDIVFRLKAIKNPIEIKNLKNALIKDGVALARFANWLYKTLKSRTVTEYEVSEKLLYFRGQQELNLGASFATIAGYGPNAAMMHYIPTKENCSVIERKGMLLVDSGGQYLDGTTDLTRTFVLGEITPEQKRDFTLVLKGSINLIKAVFLKGATGANLDILARRPVWEQGIDYKCGTGHGVGFCLNVHEGPHNFSQSLNSVKLEPGMVITVEPGVYLEGKYGIRTENMVLVVEDKKTEFGEFYKFECISYFPIDLRGVEPSILTDEERAWLNEYHALVYEKLSPHLDDDERAWLKNSTRPI